MICMVTDRTRLRRRNDGPDTLDALVELIGAAAHGGVDVIQIRERDLDGAPLAALTARCLVASHGTATKIVVNDRSDVALAAGAHGVHLRGDSVDVSRARSLLGTDALIGRSVHSADEAAGVCASAAVDYLIFGTVFPSQSKDRPQVAPPGALAAACRAARSAGPRPVPVLAIGGITIDNAAGAVRSGSAGVAAVGLFVPPDGVAPDAHIRAVVAALRRVFDTCGAVP